MDYNSKIRDSRNKAYDYHIATKILDLMAKLRLDNEQGSSRRWVWELLQNAKDVAHDGGTVNIEIDFQPDESKNPFLYFSHTGKPFTIDNITFLIEQVSTKERKKSEGLKPKTTGKFGTGFLTTHLLSEIVEVNGVVKEPELPFRRFGLQLDRTGRDIDVIIDSVNKSLATLDSIDLQPSYDTYSPYEYNTGFKYQLNPEGIEVAKTGLDDLTESLPFTLAFLPEITSVRLRFNQVEYSVRSTQTHPTGISIHTVDRKSAEEEIDINIAILSEGDVSIALPVTIGDDDAISMCEPGARVPRLFCDFPLVGSEDFVLPFIINSTSFNPNEPRSGIYLTDKNDIQVEENKRIVKIAVKLFATFLQVATNNSWKNLHLLARIKQPKSFDWLSVSWFETEVYRPITSALQSVPIVLTESNQHREIKDANGQNTIWFPYSENADVRMSIWQLVSKWIPSRIPAKEHLEFWHEIIWEGCARLRLDNISASISKQANVDNLGKVLVAGTDTIAWLNEFYAVLAAEGIFINEIISDKYSVIPNQNGIFCKKSSLSVDDNIEEELKNCLSILNIDCRNYLVHRDIQAESIPFNGSKTQQYVVDEINRIIKEGKNPKIFEACTYLITLFSSDAAFPKKRSQIFEFYRVLYPNSNISIRSIADWTDGVWADADRLMLRWFVGLISKQKTIEGFSSYSGFADNSQAIKWLHHFVSFLVDIESENLINLKSTPILPNQNGVFMAKDDLFLDSGDIPKELKDIVSELGYDFRDELLEPGIYLDLPSNRTRSPLNVSEEIIRLITPKFSEFPRLNATKQIFKDLYLWMNGNKEQAKELFGELFNNKHKLFDDDEIALNIQKSEEFTDLLDEFGIDDITDLRQILQKTSSQPSNSMQSQEIISQDILVSLGISSITELEAALKDQNLAARFNHVVTPTVEMFQFAKELIARSIKNVTAYLSQHPDYDCSDIELVATTVLAGVKKDGFPIHIVVRPSDNGEVIIYYNSEKDTLDYTNAELWIDNGKDKPEHLTLGKILKTTGITRIPV